LDDDAADELRECVRDSPRECPPIVAMLERCRSCLEWIIRVMV
jgi:hypothetical protein